MMKRIAEVSPRFKARMAGVLFLFLVLTSTFTEFFARGRLSFASSISTSQREHRPRISRILLDPDQLPDSQVDLPASVSERTHGDSGLVLADLSVTDAHKLFVPLRYGLRLPRGRIGVPVAPRDGLERS
jgi:hypothetical protein